MRGLNKKCVVSAQFARNVLPESLFAAFIDAYHTKIRNNDNKIKDIIIFKAHGIDFENHKSIMGFWIVKGKGNRGFWVEFFQDLVNKGLKKILIFVMEDFPGVEELSWNCNS